MDPTGGQLRYAVSILVQSRSAGAFAPRNGPKNLSETSAHVAYSQIHPWHLESACKWLHRLGRVEKLSAPFKLTKRSHESVEEPAYFLSPAEPA